MEQLLNGRYRVGKLIGHGGMGDVYLGTDIRLGRTVAIKILHQHLAGTREFTHRFRTEAMAAARMANPHIVRTFDGNQDHVTLPDGSVARTYYLVMEYVEGRTVRDMLSSHGPLSAGEALTVTYEVLDALAYSHRSGIVHRDIKPANVMITDSGTVKVMDFGVAHVLSDPPEGQRSDVVTGTVQYFAPEQAQGLGTDPRTDVYSTGVLLFEMLTGQLPFSGETPAAVAYQHVHAPAPRPSTLVPSLSRALDLLVLTALEKDPDRRYQSAEEFAADVQRVQHGIEPIGHAATDATIPLSLDPTSVVDQPADDASPLEGFESTPTPDEGPIIERNLKTHRVGLIWTLVGALAVLTLGAFLWLLLMPSNVASPTAQYERVPNVSSLSYTAAVQALEERGFAAVRDEKNSDTVASGTVITTDPEPGQMLARGASVTVYVSSGRERIEVPALANLSQEDATTRLQDAGLAAGTVTVDITSQLPSGTVISTSPVAGARVVKGTAVDLTVSSTIVTIPDVSGLTQTDAQNALSAVGLQMEADVVRGCTGWRDPRAVSQNPTGEVQTGTTVTVKFLQRDPNHCTQPSSEPDQDNGDSDSADQGNSDQLP